MLTLWKRHSTRCKKEHAKEFQNLDSDKHRLFKKCDCACWVTGVHPITDQYLKQSLGTTSWEAGERLKIALESEAPQITAARKMTIEEALKLWVASRQKRGASQSTVNTMYRTFEVCLLNFAKDYGVTLLGQLDVHAVNALIDSPHWSKWKASTRNRQLTNLRGFFRYATTQREWIEKNPTVNLERDADDSEMVDPYEPDELARLETAFATWTSQIETRAGQWATHPEALHCLVHVLQDSGLRISDALRVRPAIVATDNQTGAGEATLMQNKKDGKWTKKHAAVTVYLSPATLAEMKRVSWCSEKYPFMTTPPDEANRDAFKRHLHEEGIRVHTALAKIGKLAGVENCRPHRWRHTFAVKMLMNNWSLEDVARLLGHRDTITLQRHYAKWTDRRQDQLRNQRLLEFEEERNVQSISDARKMG